MDSRIESEYLKRKRGIPKLTKVIRMPNFKILQYDRSEIQIRTDLIHHNLDIVNQTKIDNKSNANQENNHIIFDARQICNKNSEDSLLELLRNELNEK